MDKIIVQKLAHLVNEWNLAMDNDDNDKAMDVLKNMRDILSAKLQESPCDVELLMSLALTWDVIEEKDSAIELLKHALICDPKNIKALLVLASVQEGYYGLEDDMLHLLESAKTDKPDETAMLLFLEAQYYRVRDERTYEKLLLMSIHHYKGYVRAYFNLARLCDGKGLYNEACYYARKAIENVKHVSSDAEHYHVINVESYIDELIKGISIPEMQFQILQELMEKSCRPMTGF